LLLIAGAAPVAAQRIVYVDDDAAANGDGRSWATAHRFLQDALADAEAVGEPVEIRVAQGLYMPDRSSVVPQGSGDRNATFRLCDRLTLQGGYAGVGASDPNVQDFRAYQTVLSGDLAGDDLPLTNPIDASGEPAREDNSYHVVSGDEDGVLEREFTAVLEGFVITAGHAFKRVSGGGPTYASPREHLGGGLFLYHVTSSPAVKVTVRHCVFENNYAEEAGGAVYGQRIEVLSLKDCRIVSNGCRGSGAGLYAMFGRTELVDCRLDANSSAFWGGAITCHDGKEITLTGCTMMSNSAAIAGGGMTITSCSAKLVDCILRYNCVEGSGGGIVVRTASPFDAVRCRFAANRAGDRGGAVVSDSLADVSFSGCLFCGNMAGTKGGAIWKWIGTLSMVNCTAWRNRSPQGSTLFDQTTSDVGNYTRGWLSVRNCILAEGPGQIKNDFGLISLEHSNLVGGQASVDDASGFVLWGPGNIDVDPLVVDPGYWDTNGTPEDPNDDVFVEGDYHLRSQAGRWDVNSATWVQDDVTSPCIDAGDPNSPIGYEPFPNGGIINMGAYGGTAEASKSYFGAPPCETIIAGDINGDCRVDIADVILLLSHWLESGL